MLSLVLGRKKTSEGETYNIVLQPITGYRVFGLTYFYHDDCIGTHE